jgi:hypothetical protein
LPTLRRFLIGTIWNTPSGDFIISIRKRKTEYRHALQIFDCRERCFDDVGAARFGSAEPPVNQQNPSTSDPKPCAPGERLQLDPQTQRPTTTGRGENLSEKLSRDEGVLRPPNLDQDIKAPTPNVGDTPVIPPPDSPGGNPRVRPK